jgi:hypothetical protein
MLLPQPQVKLPNGTVHIGWPSRLDTASEMIHKFKTEGGHYESVIYKPKDAKVMENQPQFWR